MGVSRRSHKKQGFDFAEEFRNRHINVVTAAATHKGDDMSIDPWTEMALRVIAFLPECSTKFFRQVSSFTVSDAMEKIQSSSPNKA